MREDMVDSLQRSDRNGDDLEWRMKELVIEQQDIWDNQQDVSDCDQNLEFIAWVILPCLSFWLDIPAREHTIKLYWQQFSSEEHLVKNTCNTKSPWNI